MQSTCLFCWILTFCTMSCIRFLHLLDDGVESHRKHCCQESSTEMHVLLIVRPTFGYLSRHSYLIWSVFLFSQNTYFYSFWIEFVHCRSRTAVSNLFYHSEQCEYQIPLSSCYEYILYTRTFRYSSLATYILSASTFSDWNTYFLNHLPSTKIQPCWDLFANNHYSALASLPRTGQWYESERRSIWRHSSSTSWKLLSLLYIICLLRVWLMHNQRMETNCCVQRLYTQLLRSREHGNCSTFTMV